MEEIKIKQEVILNLLVEKLYDCLEVNYKGKIEFDSYELKSKDVLFLLNQHDPIRFEAYCKFLLETNKKEEEENG